MTYQWSIFHADLEPTLGQEQAGERPVLVISAEPLNERYGVVMIAPITSRKNDRLARLGEVLLPAGTGGLPRDSFALCYQTRTLDKRRLTRRYGEVTEPSLRQQVLDTLSLCFDID